MNDTIRLADISKIRMFLEMNHVLILLLAVGVMLLTLSGVYGRLTRIERKLT